MAYHDYSPQRLDVDLGTEVNVQLQAKIKRFTAVSSTQTTRHTKAHAGGIRTREVWVQLEYVW